MLLRTVRANAVVSNLRRNASSSVIHLGSKEAFTGLEAAGAKRIYYFTATWCPPCRFIAPHFETLSVGNPDVKFVKIDIDQFGDLAENFDINSVPTFIFFNGNKKLAQFSGADVESLKKNIAALQKA